MRPSRVPPSSRRRIHSSSRHGRSGSSARASPGATRRAATRESTGDSTSMTRRVARHDRSSSASRGQRCPELHRCTVGRCRTREGRDRRPAHFQATDRGHAGSGRRGRVLRFTMGQAPAPPAPDRAELLDGKGIDYPHVAGANVTHRRAARARAAAPDQAVMFGAGADGLPGPGPDPD